MCWLARVNQCAIALTAFPMFVGNFYYTALPTVSLPKFSWMDRIVLSSTFLVVCVFKGLALGMLWPAVWLIDAPDKYFNGVRLNGKQVYKREALKTYFYLNSVVYNYRRENSIPSREYFFPGKHKSLAVAD
jgi:hypothetical protein